MMQTKKIGGNWAVVAVLILFIALATAFFGEVLFGEQSIRGIDGNYASRSVEKDMLRESSAAQWLPQYWLGRPYQMPIETKWLFRHLFPMRTELALNLVFAFSLASLFTYLLLRRYGIGRIPSIAGGLAFGFTPHFVTLIFPCHIGPMNSIMYTPMLFYAITAAIDRADGALPKTFAAALLAGLAWGMAMNEDPQRGIYVSVAAACYLVYRLWVATKRERSDSEHSTNFKRYVALIVRVAMIALVASLVFLHNFQRQMGGKNVEGAALAAENDSATDNVEQKWQFATSWSLNPRELVDSLAPGYHGSITGDDEQPYWGSRPVAHSSDSLGFFVVLLAVFGAAAGFRKDGAVRFFTIVALLATLLAFGRFWPGKPLFWLWYQLPLMDKFRAPVKFMAVASFAFAVLSGYGLHFLMTAIRERKTSIKYLQRALLLLFGIGIVWLFVLIGNEHSLRAETLLPRLGDNGKLAETAFGNSLFAVVRMEGYIVIGLSLLWLARRFRDFKFRAEVLGSAFTLLLIIDLFSIDQFYLQKSLFEPDKFLVRDGVIATLQQESKPVRVTANLKFDHNGRMVPLSLNALGNHYITYLFPYFEIESFDNTPQARVARDYRQFFSGMLSGLPDTRDARVLVRALLADNIRLWQLCNVKYLVTDGYVYGLSKRPLSIMDALESSPQITRVAVVESFAGRPQNIFKIEDMLPRFAFYQSRRMVEGNRDALKIMKQPNFDIERDVVQLVKNIDVGVPREGDSFIEPEILQTKPGYAKLLLENPADGLLLVNTRFDPGWQAKCDGRPLKPVKLNSIATGFAIGQGSGIIEIFYKAESLFFRISLSVLGLTLLSIVIVSAINVIRRKS